VRKLFGTDGIRGRANTHPMTGELMLELGRALAQVFRLGPGAERRHRVLIGKDTRRSGYMLEDALAAGLCSMGVDVLQVGPIPTPGLAFLTTDMRCDAGAMISASHNPYYDNGVKFFSGDGFKLPDEVEAKIESLMYTEELDRLRPSGMDIGQAQRIDDAAGRYIVFLKKSFPRELSLDGLRVAVDCAHGAAYKVAPTVLAELGAEVVAIGASPNGANINEGHGAMHPEALVRTVRERRADLGIALDGDADRVVLIDEQGGVIDGDQILALCGLALHAEGTLRHAKLVGTTMSNLGLELLLARHGIGLVRSDVGDRYVVEAMLREDLVLGGESSGHIVFLEHNTTGDGLLTALQVLALQRRSQRPMSELCRVFEPCPQVLRSLRVREKVPLESLDGLQGLLRRIETDLSGQGRVLVRYSGTESLVRVMVECEDGDRIDSLVEELCKELDRSIGEREG
jgi:phosphoglucosamine mutase